MTEKNKKTEEIECNDKKCPLHGSLSVRGRIFQGKVVKIKEKNLKIELERTVYISKYERYLKKKTSLHAYLPACMKNSISIGDIVEIGECRPLSKTIHHVLVKVVRKIKEIERELEEEKLEEKKENLKKKILEEKYMGEEK